MLSHEESGLAIVLPILDERPNLTGLFSRLDLEAAKIPIREVICVDDGSRDGTLEYLKEEASKSHIFHIEIVERHEKQGQVNACITGAGMASSRYVAFMDADLQHPPETLSAMYAQTQLGYELVVGCRYHGKAAVHRYPSRGVISRGAMGLSHLLLSWSRQLKDPMSGFFLTERRYVEKLIPLNNRCKLLLYVLATNKDLRTIEVPYSFEERAHGESKTVNPGFGFIFRYLIEILTYFKISPSDPRYERSGRN